MENTQAPKPYKEPFSIPRFARRNGTQLGIIGVFIALWIFYIVSAPDTFLKPRIYIALMATIPIWALMAMPLTLAVIAGEMDLSFTSIMAMGVIFFILVYEVTNNVWLAFIGALITGVIVGFINGIIVVKFGIPSLVATIGTQFFWRGAVLVLSQGKSGTLVYTKETLLHPFLVGKIGGEFPMQMGWLLIITITMWALLNRHRFGAHIYLIGDNKNSADLMGINSERVRITVFSLIGLISAFAGVVGSLYVTYFWPTMGEGYLLRTLASVFLGGTSVFGGTGTIIGTLIGAFIIGSIEAATVAIGLTGFWTKLIYGFIIVTSVTMHAYLRKRL